MSVKYGRDYVYLVWKDINTRRNYIVGQLSKNGKFEFNYGFEVEEAIKKGFKLLISFEEINKVYKSDILFPVFSSRLPDRKRKGIEGILAKYGLDEYDDYKLLKRSGAKLPIDNLRFIDPILDEDNNIIRIFYLEGIRYYIGCNGEDCENAEVLSINDNLKLTLKHENEADTNAVKVFKENVHIGYIPRYFCGSIKKLLSKGYKYDCIIYEIHKNNQCDECVKVKLEMYI